MKLSVLVLLAVFLIPTTANGIEVVDADLLEQRAVMCMFAQPDKGKVRVRCALFAIDGSGILNGVEADLPLLKDGTIPKEIMELSVQAGVAAAMKPIYREIKGPQPWLDQPI